jgi:histone deacetylase 1/2
MSHHSPNFSRNRGRFRGNWRSHSNRSTSQNRGQSVADWRPNHWQQTRRNSSAGQWSGQQHVRCQSCSGFGHTAPHCFQFCSSTPSAHLAVGNISAATWFPDTGANQHITPDLRTLTDSAPYLGNDYLHVGDGKGLDISHIGHTILHSPKRMFTLSNVLFVPHITKPLLSVQKFYRNNYVYFEFHASMFYAKDLVTKEVLLSG